MINNTAPKNVRKAPTMNWENRRKGSILGVSSTMKEFHQLRGDAEKVIGHITPQADLSTSSSKSVQSARIILWPSFER